MHLPIELHVRILLELDADDLVACHKVSTAKKSVTFARYTHSATYEPRMFYHRSVAS